MKALILICLALLAINAAIYMHSTEETEAYA